LVAILPFARATGLTDLVNRLEFRQQRLLLRETLKVEDSPDRGWLAASMQ
jgi:hypothetical protein